MQDCFSFFADMAATSHVLGVTMSRSGMGCHDVDVTFLWCHDRDVTFLALVGK